MFTGIIEAMGIIRTVVQSGTNSTFVIDSPLSHEFKIDQSVSHNGVCLTVEQVLPGSHQVTAIQETLSKTSLGTWQQGDLVNLERCMLMNGRLDGHIVQGHVDATATVTEVLDMNGSWQYTFLYPGSFAHLLIEKGSISLNGISLTIFNVTAATFSVAIIPYTYEHTNMSRLQPGHTVNLEFDMIGKYVYRKLSLSGQAPLS